MRRGFHTLLTATAATLATATALGSDARTSATAGSHRNGPGTAAATAEYDGRIGFARTDARSGKISIARGVAVGFDRDGLSLSLSNAVAADRGPGLATNVNVSIGPDGRVSSSHGVAVTNAPVHQTVSAGGSASSHGGAGSYATGRTDRFGSVRAETHAADSGRRERLIRSDRGRELAAHRGIERHRASPRVLDDDDDREVRRVVRVQRVIRRR